MANRASNRRENHASCRLKTASGAVCGRRLGLGLAFARPSSACGAVRGLSAQKALAADATGCATGTAHMLLGHGRACGRALCVVCCEAFRYSQERGYKQGKSFFAATPRPPPSPAPFCRAFWPFPAAFGVAIFLPWRVARAVLCTACWLLVLPSLARTRSAARRPRAQRGPLTPESHTSYLRARRHIPLKYDFHIAYFARRRP